MKGLDLEQSVLLAENWWPAFCVIGFMQPSSILADRRTISASHGLVLVVFLQTLRVIFGRYLVLS